MTTYDGDGSASSPEGPWSDAGVQRLPLSPEAARRKEAMLGELQHEVRRRGRRRRVVRRSTAACAAASILLIVAVGARVLPGILQGPTPPREPGPLVAASRPGDDAGGGGATSNESAVAAPVYTSIKVVTAPPAPGMTVRDAGGIGSREVVRTIGDTELLAVLAASGRDCGIVRTTSGANVVCNSCDAGETIFDPQRHRSQGERTEPADATP